MKTLIVCKSIAHGNTKKVAEVISKVLKAKIKEPKEIDADELKKYDLIGFGSGIYFGKHHKSLLSFIKKLPEMPGKEVFIFSTSGIKANSFFINQHKEIKELIQSKKFDLIEEFNCPGWDNWGFIKVIGGLKKGHPNEKDFERAREFAKKIREELE